MHKLLQQLLKKRNVEDTETLTAEEKQTFNTWNEILSKDELTLEDVKMFCRTQVDTIEGKWKDYALENQKKAELIPYHTVYKSILAAIDSPKSARLALEQQLIQLTNV